MRLESEMFILIETTQIVLPLMLYRRTRLLRDSKKLLRTRKLYCKTLQNISVVKRNEGVNICTFLRFKLSRLNQRNLSRERELLPAVNMFFYFK